MKNREWKDIIAFAVFLVTFAGLLFGFYNGIRSDMRAMRTELRADMREMRTEMRSKLQVIHGALSDVRERLAVIEAEIGISPRPIQTGVAEQGATKGGAIEQSPVTQSATARIVRDVIPAPLAWWVDVYAMRSAWNSSSRPL